MPWQKPLEGYGVIGRKGVGPASLQDGRLDSEEAESGSTFFQFLLWQQDAPSLLELPVPNCNNMTSFVFS